MLLYLYVLSIYLSIWTEIERIAMESIQPQSLLVRKMPYFIKSKTLLITS